MWIKETVFRLRLFGKNRIFLTRESMQEITRFSFAASIQPVSYTHLDVYKRQVLQDGCCQFLFHKSVFLLCDVRVKIQKCSRLYQFDRSVIKENMAGTDRYPQMPDDAEDRPDQQSQFHKQQCEPSGLRVIFNRDVYNRQA